MTVLKNNPERQASSAAKRIEGREFNPNALVPESKDRAQASAVVRPDDPVVGTEGFPDICEADIAGMY